MGKQKKLEADIKRLQIARELSEQLIDFHDEPKQNGNPDAWHKVLLKLDQHVTDMIAKRPQEQNLIIHAVRKLEYAYEKARENES